MNDVRSLAPASLGAARSMAHKAVQHLTRAARANLTATPDDSHSNLGWLEDRRAFISRPIDTAQGPISIGLSVEGLELFLLREGDSEAIGSLDGFDDNEVAERLDARLADYALVPSAPVALPYELPPEVTAVEVYSIASLGGALDGLAAWFGLANAVLTQATGQFGDIHPGLSPVRCWPHHFDIATYVSLEEGAFETARGIGIGLSPGDESYGEPYIYVNPWPHLDPAALPPAPAPGHWHTDGFVGAIATATEILTLADIPAGLSGFVGEAAQTSRQLLGA